MNIKSSILKLQAGLQTGGQGQGHPIKLKF